MAYQQRQGLVKHVDSSPKLHPHLPHGGKWPLSSVTSDNGSNYENICRQLELSCILQIHPSHCWILQEIIIQVCNSSTAIPSQQIGVGKMGGNSIAIGLRGNLDSSTDPHDSCPKADTQQYLQKHLFSERQSLA